MNSESTSLTLDSTLKICRSLLSKSWISVDKTLVNFETISGGLSNYLYKMSLSDDVKLMGNEPRKVLVRIYGDALKGNADSMIMDAVIFALLSEKGIGPQLFGVFSGGRIEEYIESRVLRRDELSLPNMAKRIASILSRLHQLHMPVSKSPDSYFRMINTWLDFLRKDFDRLPDNVKQLLTKYNLREECKWMRSVFLEEHPSAFPVVFCHNDLQENNLLYVESADDDEGFKILPIDFEYCSYGFRGFDVGNHFNEWCYDYTESTWPHYTFSPESFPSKEEQMHFWREYFKSQSQDPQDSVDYQMTPAVEESLEKEVLYGAALSHLFWTVWSFVQGLVSSIEFGYMEYGVERLETYFLAKAKLPPIV